MLQNMVMSRLRSHQRVVLAVALSGIAATLLKGGRTSYSRFKISFDAEVNARCDITKRFNLGNLLQCTKLIFEDKAPIQSKHNFEAVNWVLQNIYDITADFDEKVVCFYGNFRQPLPIVPQRSPGQVISKYLQKTSFWERVEIFSLFINMQLQNLSLTESAKVEIAQFAS